MRGKSGSLCKTVKSQRDLRPIISAPSAMRDDGAGFQSIIRRIHVPYTYDNTDRRYPMPECQTSLKA